MRDEPVICRTRTQLPVVHPVEVVAPPPVTGWVYTGGSGGLVRHRFERPTRPEPGAVVCEVVLSAICGSDLHTIEGRRTEPTPLILGHEIVGRVVAIGAGGARDWYGDPLSVGDLVTWSIIVSCGDCYFCRLNLPQKCEHLHKYGHCSCSVGQPLTGGFADCVYLMPGTDLFKVPDCLKPDIVVAANCSLATAVNALETSGIRSGDTALIQGAGLLGVYLTALCKQAGVSKVIVTDVNSERLRLAEDFGADSCVHMAKSSEEDLVDLVMSQTRLRGVDVVFEMCGMASAIQSGLRCLRIGGRYLIAGVVTDGADLDIPGQVLTKRCLTLTGIHNYRPEHLARALTFLADHVHKLPLNRIVGATYALEDFEAAVAAARSGAFLRVAVDPSMKAGEPARIGADCNDD